MPKKKKAQKELPEAAPAPVKKAKLAKKPKPQKKFSPFPALFAMWFTLFLGGASMVGVNMYQTYQHNVFAYKQAVRAQEQRARALEENRDKWDLIGAKKPQGQAVSTTPSPEASSASPEPTQTSETPPTVPEEPSTAPAPAQATEPSQKPQETQAKAPSTPSTPASNQTPTQAKPQETQPEEKPSNSGGGNVGGSGNADNFNAHNNPDQQNTEDNYVLNTSTKKFHYPSCNDVKKIKRENYETSNKSRDSIVSSGYSPCGHCNP